MDNMRLIENDLVPVYEIDTGEKVVYGTELYRTLKVGTRFTDWIKRRLDDCEAMENEDYEVLLKNEKNLKGGRPTAEYIIKLDTAKEMAMLERNEKGKRVRRYFIELEKKYKSIPRVPVNPVSPMQELSPQLQLLIGMELKQKEQAAKLTALEDRAERQDEVIKTVKDVLTGDDMTQGFSKWVIESIKKIAESTSFEEKPYRYQSAWGESYRRLTVKAGCNLDTLLKNAKKRANENGATKAQVKNISKLNVIESNKRLKELYITCIREMSVAYCMEVV